MKVFNIHMFRMLSIRLLKEPLIHFLLLGLGLFVVYQRINLEPADDPTTIVVDRNQLLTFMQYRSKAFDGKRFGEVLNRMPEEQLQQLIEAYVREEALYREAKALRLDKNDYVSRMRLVQQLEFITRGFVDTALPPPTEEEIEAYYQQHRADYYVQPWVTFTHVFFNQERHGLEKAKALAEAELKVLRDNNATFDKAPGHGDRFYYHVNYVKKEPEEIASHFGLSMQKQLFALAPSENTWYGPFQSVYGFHLVMLTSHNEGYTPALADIHDRVMDDVSRVQQEERFEASIDSIVKTYKVKQKTLKDQDENSNQNNS